ncbi:MAG TPA: hypothetical protein EYH07_10440 [Kiloniellaceae bacterium]|nr:hypothetical protein [Kiloniellaceae bacterium]HIP78866.1 hypothetical protein [Kiloniellaceae bacterium]
MNRASFALAAALALGVGFTTPAYAGTGCWGVVHAVCDWLYPSDTTVESVQKYGSCMMEGGSNCKKGREDRVNPTYLKRHVEQSPLPDPSVLKKYQRGSWQSGTQNGTRN